jgi:hypothetical protein
LSCRQLRDSEFDLFLQLHRFTSFKFMLISTSDAFLQEIPAHSRSRARNYFSTPEANYL